MKNPQIKISKAEILKIEKALPLKVKVIIFFKHPLTYFKEREKFVQRELKKIILKSFLG